MTLVFVDVETTGLRVDQHEIYEIAMIIRDKKDVKRSWWLDVDLSKADPDALRITSYYERLNKNRKTPEWAPDDARETAEEVARLTAGAHLVGLNPAFDARFLESFLAKHSFQSAWHYHLVDVEALAGGKLGLEPPWSSSDLSNMLGVEVPEKERHSAMGDIVWTQKMYDTIMLGGTKPMQF